MANEITMRGKKSLQTSGEVSQLVRSYYEKIKTAKKEGKPVVWAFGLIPREIIHAMDIPAITLEHLPVMISAKQLSDRYCQTAEEKGFSRDLCAYHTCFLGAALSDELDPYLEKRFVPPDLIIASNFPCNSEAKSFLQLVEHYKCPYFYVDAPINPWGKEVKDYAVEYHVENLEKLIRFLEQHGFKLEWEKLKEAVELSRQLLVLWQEIIEYRKNIPTPMGAVDAYTCLYPLFQLPGTKVAVEVYQKLLEEVKHRAENKIGVIENERLRLLWLGVPPAYNLGLLNYPEQYGAVIVQVEVEWIGGAMADPAIMDPEKPLESLSRKTLPDFVNPTYQNRIDLWRELVREFQIDGIITVNKRGCRNLPAGHRLLKDIIYEETGVPMTIFDLDGIDLREYDDAQTKANIDTFIETLLIKKGVKN